MLTRRCTGLSALALAVCLTGLRAADDKKPDPKEDNPKALATVAHIKLSGAPAESPAADDPLFGAVAENFKAKLDRIHKARKDDKVTALYLHLDGLELGWGRLDEMARAIKDFRKSGKKAIAFVESGATKDYLLALNCDQVLMPEAGWLMLTGVRAEAVFFKELFDNIGVKADMLQMGAYKGAAEPFTRTKLSPENRRQLESILDDFYDHEIVGRIAAARKGLNAEKVKKLIDRGPYTPKQALKAGLIDGLAYPDTIEAALKLKLGVVAVKVVKDYAKSKPEEIDFSNPFALFKMLAPPKPKTNKKPKVAVVYAVGAINTGKGGSSPLFGSTVGSTTIVEAIQQADEDATVKAIVLRVDSPGGSALASDLIWNALRQCKKPVIASMGDVAASGGYYISMGCNQIFAEPGTITGSIGVVGGKLTFGGLYDKIGLKTEVIKRGEHADILSTDRPFSQSERETFGEMMADIYDIFLTKSLEGRKRAGKKMTRKELEDLAGGRIWTGRQALKNGLVDKLGTLDDAVAEAWAQAKMPKETEPEILSLPKGRTFLDSLLEDAFGARLPLAELTKHPSFGEVSRHLGGVGGWLGLSKEPVWLMMPYSLRVR